MSKLAASIAISLTILLLIQIVPAISSGAPTPNDLYIADMDLIQVTYGPPTIIKNKSVALRLVVISTFQESVRADFRIDYDFDTKSLTDKGYDDAGIPLMPGQNIIYLPGGSYYSSERWATDPMGLSWTTVGNDAELVVTVDSLHQVMETVENNNMMRYTAGVHVVQAQSMRLLVVPIYNDDTGQYEFEEGLDQNLNVLRDQYPVADDGINVTLAPWEYREYEDHNEAADIARSFSDDARSMGYDRVIVVFKKLYYGTGQLLGRACGMLRDPEDRVPFLVTSVGLSLSSDLLAHELGHTYYLWHPHDIGLMLYETDIWDITTRMYGMDASTTMSYDWKLPDGVPSWPRWMDEQRYRTYPKTWLDLSDRANSVVDGVWQWNLYDQFVTYPIFKAPSILITGRLFINGTAIIDRHIQHLAAAPRDLVQAIGFVNSGSYSLRVLDASHMSLGDFPFHASFDEMAYWDSISEVYERQLNEVEFSFNIPEVAGAKYLQLVDHDGEVMVQREISDNAPEVQIITPSADIEMEVGDALNITWSSDDPDGDDLVYRVAFSADGGSWVPVADDITENWYQMGTSGLGPGDGYQVKVIASDGYNSAECVSDAFSLVDTTPPDTTITVEGTEGQNGWYVSSVRIVLNSTDNCQVDRTEFSYDGTTWTDYAGEIELTEEGDSTLHYRSIDGEGNTEVAKTVQIPIDLTAPSVQIMDPSEGTVLTNGRMTVTWSSSDAMSGISGHKVRLDGGVWTDVGIANQFDVANISEGQHTLEVMAVDEAGNQNISLIGFSVNEGSLLSTELLMVLAVLIIISLVAMTYILMRRKKA